MELFWDLYWAFLGWYVNLQAPLVVHGDYFDTTDWALDVVERVVAEAPWPTGWEDWRPSAHWLPLSLPDDWAEI